MTGAVSAFTTFRSCYTTHSILMVPQLLTGTFPRISSLTTHLVRVGIYEENGLSLDRMKDNLHNNWSLKI